MAMIDPGVRVNVQANGRKVKGRVMDTATLCVQVLVDGEREGTWFDWADVTPDEGK